MQVRNIMSSPVLSIGAGQPLEEAARRMVEHHVGSLIVLDGKGAAVGILTKRDLAPQEPANPFQEHRRPQVAGQVVSGGLRALYADLRRAPITSVMRPIRVSLAEDDPVERAMDLMLRHDRFHLPVLRDGRAVGIVARIDLIRLMWAAEVDLPKPPVQETIPRWSTMGKRSAR